MLKCNKVKLRDACPEYIAKMCVHPYDYKLKLYGGSAVSALEKYLIWVEDVIDNSTTSAFDYHRDEIEKAMMNSYDLEVWIEDTR